MTGAEYVARFLHAVGVRRAYTVTGGACAFLIDAVARHPDLDYVCFQHEQAAAMAADSVWRVRGVPGATIATSGPGATNLITGIACSYFDSIPAIHLTGQVNRSESAAFFNAKVRQAGFQETNIVDMARPITKYAVQVNSAEQLRRELQVAYEEAMGGRMGPVLIDIPMNLQKADVGARLEFRKPADVATRKPAAEVIAAARRDIDRLLQSANRPLVLLGGGLGLAGATAHAIDWIREQRLPFVASWSGMQYFDHSEPLYCGQIGVYGNRGANFILQNCDALLVFGSRLDTRQRSAAPERFAPGAHVLVFDVDAEELKKYQANNYSTCEFDLAFLHAALTDISYDRAANPEWLAHIAAMKEQYLWKPIAGERPGFLSPYEIVQRINSLIRRDAVVVADCGANLCWVYQIFKRIGQTLYTAAGNSPMGYSVAAAIGAALEAPGRQVVCFIGDGGLQMNIQELQTIVHYRLPITIVVLNNRGYGIIKQFQDSYFESRYEATGRGYSLPDFGKVASAYGIGYQRVENLQQITNEMFETGKPCLIDVVLDQNTQILPKLEMGRPINDQFPYVSEAEFVNGNAFVKFSRDIKR